MFVDGGSRSAYPFPGFRPCASIASPYLPSRLAGEALPPPLDISPGSRAEWDFNPPDTSAVRHALRNRPTPHPRACPSYGCCLHGPVRRFGRTRMRSPRFRAEASPRVGTPTARGSSSASHFSRGGCCLLIKRTRSAPRNSTRFAAQYPAHGRPCERFKLSLAASPCITRGRGGWLGLTPWKTCTSCPLPACPGALRVGSFFPVGPLSAIGVRRTHRLSA